MSELRMLSFTRPARELVERAAEFRTPDVANALGPTVVAAPILRPVWRGAKVFGPAFTVELAPGDNLGANAAALWAAAGDVIVIASNADPVHPGAIIGGLNSRVARHRGVAGVVVDGASRDSDDIAALGFPVWSRLISPRQASKTQPAILGGAVHCAGLRISAGDLVIADQDGVVVIPQAMLAEAIPKVQAVVEREKALEADPDLLEAAMNKVVSALPRVDVRSDST